ncbi:hypothetical protein [uncultured Sunxiuqinia sp.]|uniref:hypothetical protein n=1 Tax=uncultured Sunxiuqinia sp. TaxID=1573825 RepID=UPI00260C453C|nr:hypothetical protein [uncultured Sunxiuqinia sp.]
MNYPKLFITAFMQVFLVSANTYFISRTEWAGIAICGFGISYLWTINVRKVVVGSWPSKVIYAVGAMSGGLLGVVIARLIKP